MLLAHPAGKIPRAAPLNRGVMLSLKESMATSVGNLVERKLFALRPRPVAYLLVPERFLGRDSLIRRIVYRSHRRVCTSGIDFRWVLADLRQKTFKFLLKLLELPYVHQVPLRFILRSCLVLERNDVLNAMRYEMGGLRSVPFCHWPRRGRSSPRPRSLIDRGGGDMKLRLPRA